MRLRNIISSWFTECLLAGLCASIPAVAAGSGEEPPLDRALEALKEGAYDEAARTLNALPPDAVDSARSSYLRGWLTFVEGDYNEALRLIKAAIEAEKSSEEWKSLRDLVSTALELTRDFEEVSDPDRRFRVRYPKGIDRVLASYTLDVLSAESRFLSGVFGESYAFPIVVEILPDAASLARMAEAEETDVERTGTVAVTHFGRISLLSPRALERGYPWMETLAHELVHLYVTRLSGDRAPGWMQEGLARLLQSGWSQDSAGYGHLTPVEEYLLDRAAREGRLLPLTRMNRSLLQLSSQEEAVLAMAQAASFTRYLSKRRGEVVWKEILGQLPQGLSMSDAVNLSMKAPFGRVYSWWLESLQGKRLAPPAAVRLLQRKFRKGEIGTDNVPDGFADPQVDKKVRLADLLVRRGHMAAAAAEYRYAGQMAGDPDPLIANKLARCEMALGQPDKAAARLKELAPLYPYLPATFTALAEAEQALGHADTALAAYRQSLALDPFDPAAVCGMAELMKRHPGPDMERFEEHCRAVTEGSPKVPGPDFLPEPKPL